MQKTKYTSTKNATYKPKDNKIRVIGCNNCHQSNVTLIKGPDSYYCKFCYEKLFKNRKENNNE